MSMQPQPWPEVPASTAKIAKRAFRKGSLAMRARDQLGAWYQDEAFGATYGTRGAPGISPAQLAMVTVLQFTEDLTDRQAADAVRGRLDWKYCLGLALDHEGFDFSVLSEFRARLVAGAMEAALLEALLTRLGALGLVGAGMPQRTDSTHVLGRIRDLNRLELAGETVRAALEALAAAAPGWLAQVIDASWQEVYGQRIDDFRLPRSTTRRAGLAVRYGRDGYLLRQVHGPGAPGWLRDLPAVQALRRIWVQQFYLQAGEGGEKVIWRGDEQGLPPARSRLVSPYDTDVRYAEKRGKGWTGYKVHLSETCPIPRCGRPPPGPGPAHQRRDHAGSGDRRGDDRAGTRHAGPARPEARRARRRQRVCQRRAAAGRPRPRHHAARPRCCPIPPRRPAPAGTPQPCSPSTGRPGRSPAPKGRYPAPGPRPAARGPASSWPGSPRRPASPARPGPGAPPRSAPAASSASVHRQVHEALTAARAEQAGDAWQRRYRIRAGVEGTIAQATHVTGIRRARYLGLDKTRLEHNTAAAAINLIRLDAWWTGKPLDRTRTTHLQRLDLAALKPKT